MHTPVHLCKTKLQRKLLKDTNCALLFSVLRLFPLIEFSAISKNVHYQKPFALAEISTGNLIVIPTRNVFRSRRFSIDFFSNDLNRGQHLFLAYDSKERLGSYSIYLALINSGKILKNLYHLII